MSRVGVSGDYFAHPNGAIEAGALSTLGARGGDYCVNRGCGARLTQLNHPATTPADYRNYTRYVHGPTGLLAQQNPAGVFHWMLQDGLQSVRAISDGTNVLSAQAYSPYGEPLFSDLPTDFGFTGEQTDSTNDLVYLRARYMSPKLGTFGSLDPFEGELSTPLTMNGYGWVEGNTPNLTDASGLTSGLSSNTCNMKNGLTSGIPTPEPVPTPEPTVVPTPTLQVNEEFPISAAKPYIDAAYYCLTSPFCDTVLLGRKPENAVDALALIIEAISRDWPKAETVEIIDAMSYLITGATGSSTIYVANTRPHHPIHMLTTGFHKHYYQSAGQPYHYFAYLNTVAQGGDVLALLGDVAHECINIVQGNGTILTQNSQGTTTDARLTSLAVRHGNNSNINPMDFAKMLRQDLSTSFKGPLASWYYTDPIGSCRRLADLDNMERGVNFSSLRYDPIDLLNP